MFAGAGVSRRAGLPSFKELVGSVYENLRETVADNPAEKSAYDDSAFDRVLNLLEKRLGRGIDDPGIRVRLEVAKALQPPSPPFKDHLALLGISRDKHGQPNIVTTNFDTLFERADESLQSSGGSGLPPPGSARDHGVQHLHGRIGDELRKLSATDLILTSADFGEAYLRSGWASRYVADRLRLTDLVLVGYSANDAPMKLLLDAIDAERVRFPDVRKIYALGNYSLDGDGDGDTEEKWRALGVDPVLGQSRDSVYASIRHWSKYCDKRDTFARAIFSLILNKVQSSATNFEREQVEFLWKRHGTPQLFEEIDPDITWLNTLIGDGEQTP